MPVVNRVLAGDQRKQNKGGQLVGKQMHGQVAPSLTSPDCVCL